MGKTDLGKWKSLPRGGESHRPKDVTSQPPGWKALSKRAGILVWFGHGCLGCATRQILIFEVSVVGKTPGGVCSEPQRTPMMRTPRALEQGHAYTAENYTLSKHCCWTLGDRKCLTTGTE